MTSFTTRADFIRSSAYTKKFQLHSIYSKTHEYLNPGELQNMEVIIKSRRPKWFGHVVLMNDDRFLKQIMHWEANTMKRTTVRSRRNWTDTIRQDLKEIGMSWEEAQERFADGEDGRQCVNVCGPVCFRHALNQRARYLK